MSVAILGAGHVGQALGLALAAKRYTVRFGVRDPQRHADLEGSGKAAGRMSVSTVEEAIADADLVILATPYAAALQIAREQGDWQQRILVDATNPLAPGLDGLLLGTTTSGAEQIAAAAQGARVVKAFNSTGFENLQRPQYPGGALFMPVAGDDADARRRVIALAALIGFDAVDLGPLSAARTIEPLAMLWIHMAMQLGHGRQFGFLRGFSPQTRNPPQ